MPADPLTLRLADVGARLKAAAASAERTQDGPVDVSRLALLLNPDATPPTDDEWQRYLNTLSRPDQRAAPKTARWWCTLCGAFAGGQWVPCAKCRHEGPHHHGEDSPLAVGNRARRARLRSTHVKRHRRT